MPIYTFHNTETDEHFEEFMSIADKEKYLLENPHIKQTILHAPALADPTRVGRAKPNDGFRDRLKEIKKSHRGSNINTW